MSSAVDTESVGSREGTPGAGRAEKRKRSTKACDACHRKKIKCDGAAPCGHCVHAKAECAYTPSTKKRGPRVGYIESLEKRLSMMESLLSNHVPGAVGELAALPALSALAGLGGLAAETGEPRGRAPRGRGRGRGRGGAGHAPSPALPLAPSPAPSAASAAAAALGMQAALAAGNGARAAARGRQPARKPGRLATAAAAGSRHAAPPGTISPGVANPLLFARIDSGTPSNAGSDRRRQASASAAGFSYAEESDDAASDSQDRDDGYGSGSESGSDDGGYADGDEPAVHANGGVLYPDGGLQLHSPRAQPAATALAQVAAHHAPRQSFSDSVSVHSAGSEVGSSAREPPYGENEVIMPLITLFFSHVYPLMPIIHRSSFLENLIPTNQHPPLLLNAIYTMSARFSNDPLIYTDPRRPYAAGDPFFNRAKKLLQNAMDEPSVPTVQALLLLALGAAGSGKGSLGWMYTGMAIRMAQEMKMNIDYEDLPMVDKPLGWIDRETRRRIWWSCFNMDRCISAGADRPFTIDERDCLLSLPADETIWEHTHSSFVDDDGSGLFSNSRLPRIPFTNTLPYTPPPPGSPPLGHNALNVVLIDILGKVLRYANQARRSNNRAVAGALQGMGTGMGLGYHVARSGNNSMIDSELAILDASLRNWYRSLPPELTHPHLSGFPYNQHMWMGGYLHITYHAVLVILHRPSFPFPYGPLPIPQSEIGAATHNDPPNGPIASIYHHPDEPGHPHIPEPQLPPNNPVWPTPISRDVCTTSAERVGKILEEVIVPNPFLNRFSGFAAYSMFHTGVVHIINAVYPYDTNNAGPTAVSGDVGARARRYIKAHVLGLRRMTRFWSLAGRYLEALEHLMRANGLDKEFDEAVAGEKQFAVELGHAFRAEDDEEFGILAGAAGMRPPSPDLPAAPAHRGSNAGFQGRGAHDHMGLFDPASPPSGLGKNSSVMDLGFPIDSVAGIGALHLPWGAGTPHSSFHVATPTNPLSPEFEVEERAPPKTNGKAVAAQSD